MNSSKSNPSQSSEDANGIEELAIDEPFDGESTGVRPRAGRRLPLANDGLCEEVSQFDDELPSEEFVLPTWEELTGLRRRARTGLSFRSSSGRQQAIDLVEAEQRRRSTMPPDGRMEQRAPDSTGMGRGSWREASPEPSLPWVDRFERDTNARLEAPELEQEDQIAQLQERFAASSRPPAALPVPPPPPASTLRSAQPGPPPSTRPISRSHVPSSFPANRPLPRFALGPRMEGLLGSERRPLSARTPASLAPVAANDIRLQPRMNPWAAGLLGALMSAAACFAFLWSPESASRSAASVAAPVSEESTSETEAKAPPFEQKAALQLASGAAEKARACGMGKVPTKIGVTFAPDGSVMSVEARAESRLSEDTAFCMDDTFSNLRVPPFDGKAREVNLTLP